MAIFRTGHRRWLKGAGKWFIFCLVLLAIVIHVSVKIWPAPQYFSARAQEELSGLWDGPVSVGDVDFYYSGVIFVRDAEFFDTNAKELIKAQAIRIALGNWPAVKIEIDRLDVCFRLEDGNVCLPLRGGQQPDAGQFDLENIAVKHAAFSLEDDASRVSFSPVSFRISKVADRYEFSTSSISDGDGNSMQLKGFSGVKGEETEFDLKFTIQAGRELMRMVMSEMDLPEGWYCSGTADGELKVRGNLNDSQSLWPLGEVELTEWTFLDDNNVVAENVGGLLVVKNHRLDFVRMGGFLYKGGFNGSFFVDDKGPGPVSYGADLKATDIDMTQFTRNWETAKRFTRGAGLLNLRFTADASGLDSIRGNGELFVDSADLWRIPVIGELFKVIGVWQDNTGEMSDAEAVFDLNGLRMTLRQGLLSNRFSAIEAEPGGSIDLNDGQIDLYVVALPMKNIDLIASELPVVNWFVKLKDKIVRLHLKGYWMQPASQLISKQPVKDIKEGTVEFFRAVIESGGKISEKIRGVEFFIEQGQKNPQN